jgi:hypothetical protein
MTPARHFVYDAENLCTREVLYPTRVQVMRWIACNVRCIAVWMFTQKWPADDVLRHEARRIRFKPWRRWDIHARLVWRWGLREKLGR